MGIPRVVMMPVLLRRPPARWVIPPIGLSIFRVISMRPRLIMLRSMSILRVLLM